MHTSILARVLFIALILPLAGASTAGCTQRTIEDQVAPALELDVSRVPGLAWTPVHVVARYYAANSQRMVHEKEVRVERDGSVEFPALRSMQELGLEEVRFSVQTERVEVPLRERDSGRTSFSLLGADGWRLEPLVPLICVCQVDERGEVILDGAPELTFNVGLEANSPRRHTLLMTRPELDRGLWLNLLHEEYGVSYPFPGTLVPVDGDGVMRVDHREIYTAPGRFEVVSEFDLPEQAWIRLEREVAGQWVRMFNTPEHCERSSDRRYEISKLYPGNYRVYLYSYGELRDGDEFIGTVNVAPGEAPVLRIEHEVASGILTVRVLFDEEFDARGMRAWKLDLDPDRRRTEWHTTKGSKLEILWLGERPTHARLSGYQGPLDPKVFPLTWTDRGSATLDARGERLLRCDLIHSFEGARSDRLTSVACEGFAESWRLPASPAVYRQQRNLRLEVLWWSGSEARVPLIRPAGPVKSNRETAQLLSWVRLGELQEQKDLVLGHGSLEPVDLLLRSRNATTVSVWIWLGSTPPDGASLQDPLGESRLSKDLLFQFTHRFASRRRMSVPTVDCDLILYDHLRARSAYLPAGSWGPAVNSELDLDALDWR